MWGYENDLKFFWRYLTIQNRSDRKIHYNVENLGKTNEYFVMLLYENCKDSIKNFTIFNSTYYFDENWDWKAKVFTFSYLFNHGGPYHIEISQWSRSGVFIVNFEHISYLFLVFLLLPLNKKMLTGMKAAWFV